MRPRSCCKAACSCGRSVSTGCAGYVVAMTVYQVVADGLRSEFPVLRNVDHFAGNLPQQLTSFVGREDLVADVAEHVRSNRLVTLSGVGGVGKTQAGARGGCRARRRFPGRRLGGRARADR